ncbi:ELWxxDGT repeat protein [Aeromicrobium sp.]|uniref:ELWxxDGT repeat protein n=1 Tax=Aeromicrobium sp. TaxID=1871063 RepID=UPI0028A5B360|nr:ELWxxDGT repeat protein [Aeromicrobium sp.]
MLGDLRHPLTKARRSAAIVLTAGALALGTMTAAPPAQAASSWSWTANLVSDIDRSGGGGGSSTPREFTRLGGSIYFSASSPGLGNELWRSDGTAAGTRLVKDIRPGRANSSPSLLAVAGRNLYFATVNSNGDRSQLWKSDGTTKGTVKVADLPVESAVVAVGSTAYFVADHAGGSELWKTRGTAATTVRVKDIVPGGRGSRPDHLTAVGSRLFFTAQDAAGVDRLWRSDGTEAGTVMVDAGRPDGEFASHPDELFAAQGRLWFRASDDAHGSELWTSDGTEAGTRVLKDLAPGSDHHGEPSWGWPKDLTLFRGLVYFSAVSSDTDRGALWRSDGTEEGTVRVASAGRAEGLTVAGNRLYFFADDGKHGLELWTSDGTAGGTRMVVDVASPNAPPADEDDDDSPYHSVAELQAVGDRVVFTASTTRHGRELWASDGTATGTRLVRDINPDQRDWFTIYDDYPARGSRGVLGNTVIFSAQDGKHGVEPWKASWAPINTFTLPRAATAYPKRGTAKVALTLPNAGTVRLSPTKSRTVRGYAKKVGSSGRVNVYLVPTKALRKALVKKARARKKSLVATRVGVKVTYTPSQGSPRTRAQTYTIRLRVKR